MLAAAERTGESISAYVREAVEARRAGRPALGRPERQELGAAVGQLRVAGRNLNRLLQLFEVCRARPDLKHIVPGPEVQDEVARAVEDLRRAELTLRGALGLAGLAPRPGAGDR